MLQYNLSKISQLANKVKSAGNMLESATKKMAIAKQVSDNAKKISANLERISPKIQLLSKRFNDIVTEIQEAERKTESLSGAVQMEAASMADASKTVISNPSKSTLQEESNYQAGEPFHNRSIEEVGGEEVVRDRVKSYFAQYGLDVSEAIDQTNITIIPENEWSQYLATNGLPSSVEAYCHDGTIIMPSNTASNTLVHELIHCTGKVAEKGWEEAITEYLAQEICDVQHMTGYDVSVQAMETIANQLQTSKNINFAEMLCKAKVNQDLSPVKTLLSSMSSEAEVNEMTRMMNKLNIDRFRGASNPWTPYWEQKEIELTNLVANMIS